LKIRYLFFHYLDVSIGLISVRNSDFSIKKDIFYSKNKHFAPYCHRQAPKTEKLFDKKICFAYNNTNDISRETWEQSRVRSPLNEKRQTNISFVVYFFIKLQIQSFCLYICLFSVRSSNDGMFLHRSFVRMFAMKLLFQRASDGTSTKATLRGAVTCPKPHRHAGFSCKLRNQTDH